MTTLEIFILIIASAVIQASFQLSVSMVTVMSGHALGKKTALLRLSSLVSAFTLGAMAMVALSASFIVVVITNLFAYIPTSLWSIVSGLFIGVGVAVWLFYYRHRTGGTVLWVPRPIANYLAKRARATSSEPEAFSLGLTSVIGEIVFTAAPTVLVALLLTQLQPTLQLVGLLAYTLIATLPLFIISMDVAGGGSLARIQRWRERNKRFLQFTAGSALIVLGVYLYVELVVTPIALGAQL